MRRKNLKATETRSDVGAPSASSQDFDQKSIATIAKLMATIADRKSTMPMLARMLIRRSSTGTTILATDLNVSLMATLPHLMGPTLDFSIKAREASDVLGELPAGPISVRMGDHFATFGTTSGASINMESIHGRDFPALRSLALSDVHEKAWVSLDNVRPLVEMFEETKHSVCRDETRFHLAGIHLECDSGRAICVSTDGHRLTKTQRDVPGLPYLKGKIIPMAGINAILRVIGKSDGCDFLATESHVYVRAGIYTLAVKCIDALFPAYEQVIPKGNNRLATVDRRTLLATMNRAKKFASDTRGVKLTIGDSLLKIVADDPDNGTFRESLPAIGQAAEDPNKSITVGANPRFVIEAIKAFDDDRVTFALSPTSELDPILVRPTECAGCFALADSPHAAVIMPMRI